MQYIISLLILRAMFLNSGNFYETRCAMRVCTAKDATSTTVYG